MYALVPHKDTLFFLYQVQKEVISLYNHKYASDTDFIYPSFPLWAFCDKDIFTDKINQCSIDGIDIDKDKAFFTVKLQSGQKDYILKIVFAAGQSDIKPQIKDLDFSARQNFPLYQRVFRKGEVLHKDNVFKLYDDKWIKVVS